MPKTTRIVVIALSLIAVIALSFAAGYASGNRGIFTSSEGIETVAEAWNIVFRDYVDRDQLDAFKLRQAAIEGMVEELDDPYTAYLDEETYQLSLSRLEGKFEGIGAHVAVKDEKLVIVAPIEGSPAARAGIRAGDIIIEIDGKPAAEMSPTEAVLNVRGPAGTAVRLLILHQGETEPQEIEVVRAEIELPSVRFEMKDSTAYIRITHFSERTNEELTSALLSTVSEAATGIILDLRSNPGGPVKPVVDVASHFISKGIVLSMVDNKGRPTYFEIQSKGVITDLPLIVLVDGSSASGSEVLAGALQDHGRAAIAGSRTFGKGSVNILHQLQDGSGLYITTARWLTPDGHLIEGKGIEPDYELELEGEAAIEWAIDYLKDK